MHRFLHLALPCLALTLSLMACTSDESTEAKTGTTYQVYFAGGQSNMEGFGFENDLPEEYRSLGQNIRIFSGHTVPDDVEGGGTGQWLPLSPGFGTGYQASADSVYLSNRFGPELSFGKRMAELTGEPIAIIKYARGGSSIELGASGYGTWKKNYQDSTTINQWDHFQHTLDLAFAQKDINGDGLQDTLVPAGIIWMQGESDATKEGAAQAYYDNLSQLMKDITAAFGVEELPIVICRIRDSGQTPEERLMPYIETVWDAQVRYARDNDHVELIRLQEPIEFLDDGWHYASRHYLEMGELFAEKLGSR